MTVPTRPAANNPVATDWGQAVHDHAFRYACILDRTTDLSLSASTFTDTLMETGTHDPINMLSSGKIVIPVNGLWEIYRQAQFSTAVATVILSMELDNVENVAYRQYFDNPGAGIHVHDSIWITLGSGIVVGLSTYSSSANTVQNARLGARLIAQI